VNSAPDDKLVEACLAGDDAAWAALIARYKNLVYSVPMRYRLTPEDAADVFQSVWLDLYSELRNLRSAGAIRGWLLTVAAHKCYHLRRKQVARGDTVSPDFNPDELPSASDSAAWHDQAEKEQVFRQAIEQLPQRCQEVVRMLFYQDPPLPYSEVAKRLGLAEGSIGFIRGRCLKKLRDQLERTGF